MATSKPKTAKKSAGKKASAKPKTANAKAKTAKSVAAKTTKKEKVTTKADKSAVETEKTVIVSSKVEKSHPVKEFFARKGDNKETILTIFKDTKIIGAVIAEIIGTGLVTAIALTLGLYNPLYMIFGYIGVTAAVFKISGAHLNPIITVGMMASRRVSAIRGILYIVAQILGAWFAFMIINGFYQAGIASGNIVAESTSLPALAATSDLAATAEGFSFFWPVTMIEFVGAIILAFFFARALNYKRGVYTFAAIVGSGIFIAMLYAVIISSNYLGISNENVFIMNPASALMYGLLPASAEGFDALMGALMPMLVTYVIFPMLGGVLGFYISDLASKLSGQEYAN